MDSKQFDMKLFEVFAAINIMPGSVVKYKGERGVVVSMKKMAEWVFEVMFNNGRLGYFRANEIEAV